MQVSNMKPHHKHHFPVCPNSDILPLIEMKQVPIHCNLLWPNRAEAINAPRGDIRLGYFPECGHIYNLDFDPVLMEYTQAYENSLHFSDRFQQYATAVAQYLIDKYALNHKEVIEIGAGKGDFLIMLARMGNNHCLGFDPSYIPDEAYTDEKVTFIQDFYSEKYANFQADLIVCRHTLEHIEDPDAFMMMVRRAVGGRSNTVIFFEVPNALFTLRHLGIWDIIYEHCSYFSPNSIVHLFRKHGFQVLKVNELFGGQFLTIEAMPGSDPTVFATEQHADLAQITADVKSFSKKYHQKVAQWQQILRQAADDGRKVVIWGAGSKGVTFLNVLCEQSVIHYVVDINPRKQGMFVAGTGQSIVPPTFLATYKPDIVIIMNANYKDEIQNQLNSMQITAKIMIAS